MRKRGEGPRERVRKPRFTPHQSQVLMERTVAHAPHLFGERTSPVSVRKRIWQEVAQAVNAISKTKRSVREVQKRWRDERRRIKHRAQDLWQALAQTGVPMGQLTPLEEAVVATFNDATIKKRLGRLIGPPTLTVPLRVLIQQLKTGIISPEPPGVDRQPAPPIPPAPVSVLTPLSTLAPVCVDDIKQEPDGSEVSDVVQTPQGAWKFEWTVEDTSVAPPQTPAAPGMSQPVPSTPISATHPLGNDSLVLSCPPKDSLKTKSHTGGSWPWGRKGRQRRTRDLGARHASRTACSCRAACGNRVVGRQLRVLSDNVLAIRGELSALVAAVTTIATTMQSRAGTGAQDSGQHHSMNPVDQNQRRELTDRQEWDIPH
ncbi:hypothetical protein AAFF_G00022730 [Aldrovandia affinis]|uniref:Myb/SANT-like DNA-binding domain-containing protein n=1 Tax=Aldrovandia affinis TaxID=143900 RepID=A0AAD7WZH9_9TELE|nr:hypothetical protein AAFF_G00022730 [Aldrovandia affinis]